jgi:hypothetical protein
MLRLSLAAVLVLATAACAGSSSRPLPTADGFDSASTGGSSGSSGSSGSTYDDPPADDLRDLGDPDPNQQLTMVLTLIQGHGSDETAYDPTNDPACRDGGPSATTVASVVTYFQNDGLKQQPPSGCTQLAFIGTASEIAASLQVTIRLFSRNGVKEADITSQGSAPRTIARAIDHIDLAL